ncbi:amidohydrolase [Xanthobacter tagetidis]|uniref:Amidohydrolase n=1 Tax=Xanthobacter tagetidis TaxID=60216 RepID=A0A3L7ADG7_9HYPH|nr:amidohydrolase [Xanthobacter tagetidis]MBB6309692.1 hippurate hydrolase [Xanthobacter tagetidis]RLP78267.1 amidohydrolase [Xanthobacter tagetidis]
MPVNNRIAAAAAEIAGWRQALHRRPELQYDLPLTAAYVAAKLREFGCDEVAEGIGGTGVVGVIRGRGPGRAVALRADMDALPIVEATGASYASEHPGRMHACGHDGHMAMLLGATRHLAETRAFAGTVNVVFQPAEEGGAGARAMVEDGLFSRFPSDAVYGMHNMPGMEVGRFAMRPGPIMASSDQMEIVVEGRGGHAAKPEQGIDAVLCAAAIVTGLQQVVARNVAPLDAAVVSVCVFQAGEVDNVLPPRARLLGTVRALDAAVRLKVFKRVEEVAHGIAAAHGATATVRFKEGYPVTRNHDAEAAFAADVAREVVGDDHVDDATVPMMWAEDFAFMLEALPGAYVFIGNGPSSGLHSPTYDFCDDAIAYGASYWVRLAERALGAAREVAA